MHFSKDNAAIASVRFTAPVFAGMNMGFGAHMVWCEPKAHVDSDWVYGYDDEEEVEREELEETEIDDDLLDADVPMVAGQVEDSSFGPPLSAVVGITNEFYLLGLYPIKMSWTATSWEETLLYEEMEWESTCEEMDWEPTLVDPDVQMGNC